MRFVFLLPILLATAFAQAPEPSTPVPPAPRSVPLHFAPPPLPGTISLGIYDSSGKLVRVLHREDEISDFTAGHDALETSWDGNDDAGRPLPPGKYRARGYLVGDLKIEGIAYFFNDWVTDEDSPRIVRIARIALSDDQLQLEASTIEGNTGLFTVDPVTQKLTPNKSADFPVLSPNESPLLIDPVATAPGRNGTIWVINHVAKGSREVEIVQLSPEPAVLRKLAIAPADPQPIGIAASPREDKLFLLEESPGLERVRALTLQSVTPASGAGEPVSDWKVDFEKKIVAHENFSLRGGVPAVTPSESATPSPKVPRKLRPNPLERDQPGKVDLMVDFDGEGSYLQTADGLPLRTVSDNRGLKRALIIPHGDEAVDVFADDGSVVEQFRISRLDQMMAFDGGEFVLK